MIDQKKLNIIVAEGMEKATRCTIAKSNIASAPIPPYPYVSFSIINSENGRGTYAVGERKQYITLKQTWSITVQGDNDNETMEKALAAKDWFEAAGQTYLNDNGVVVQSVGAIANRDNFITIEYEYRKGFDVVLTLINEIGIPEVETIEQANLEGVK